MTALDRVVDTIRCDVFGGVSRRWADLETDSKSVTLASAVIGAVIGLGVQIPW